MHWIADRLVAAGIARRRQIVGYSEHELLLLEEELGFEIPRAYHEFLRAMGHGAGSSRRESQMSRDLYLLDLSPSDDAEAALRRMKKLESGNREDGGGSMKRKLEIAQILIEADPRYEVFDKDFEAIAESEGISVEEAQSQYAWVELNGPGEERMAQIIIDVNYIEIFWYSGTSDVEMDMYLRLPCQETGYAVFDPQTSSIQWYSDEDGWYTSDDGSLLPL